MRVRSLLVATALAFSAQIVLGQPPPARPDGPARRAPRPNADAPQPGQPPQAIVGWIEPHDENRNGNLESEEFEAAVARTFAELDRNGSGSIEPDEAEGRRPLRRPLPAEGPPSHGSPTPPPAAIGKRLLPPFFFAEKLRGRTTTRAEFIQIAAETFAELDKDGNRVLSRDEAARHLPPVPSPPPGPPMRQPVAPRPPRMLDALQFGDKLVSGQPFSAETVIEDTRRLFDGTTTRKERRGAIYRDQAGRTRREQPLDIVTRFSMESSGSKPFMLVFINDFPAKTQYSIDGEQKIARKSTILENRWSGNDEDTPSDAKKVSLGTKEIEGVKVEGTRITREIPVGRIGNDKPLEVVTERWFSPELQVVVMSRHLDPMSGEHVFKLVNIKRTEPAASLFTVPAGYRIENASLAPRPQR